MIISDKFASIFYIFFLWKMLCAKYFVKKLLTGSYKLILLTKFVSVS